jgi:hypothetical protein
MARDIDPNGFLRGFDLFAGLGVRLDPFLNRILSWRTARSKGTALGREHRSRLAAGEQRLVVERLEEIDGWLEVAWAGDPGDAELEIAVIHWEYLAALLRVSTGLRSTEESLEPWQTFRDHLSIHGRLNPDPGLGIVIPSFSTPIDMPGGLVFMRQDEGAVRINYRDFGSLFPIGMSLLEDMSVLFHATAGKGDVKFIGKDVLGKFQGFEIQHLDELALATRAADHLERASRAVAQPYIVILPELVAPELVQEAIVARTLMLPVDQRPLLIVAGSHLASVPGFDLPFNQVDVFTGTGELLFSQLKNWPFELPRDYVDRFDLGSFGLKGGEVEAISVPTPPELTVADVGFARIAILICEDLGHLEEGLLDAVHKTGVTLLVVPVMSRDLGEDWTERLGDVIRWVKGREIFVLVVNSRVLPERLIPRPADEISIGLVIRKPYGTLTGNPNSKVSVSTADTSYLGFVGISKLRP